MTPSPAAEFSFDSSGPTPYMSAPGSPQLNNSFFFSAPTTPSRFIPFHGDFNNTSSGAGDSPSSIPFKWEDKPGIPKSKEFSDFEFHFQTHVSTSLSAEDFFESGQIKPLKPPPRLQFLESGTLDSPKSPRSPISVKILKEVLSPRNQKNDFDPFAAAIQRTLEQGTHDCFEQQHSFSSSSSSSAGRTRKWKLKKLFVLGRAADEEDDSFKKYGILLSGNREGEDVRNPRFESEELKRKNKKGLFGFLGFNHAVNVNHKISRAIGSICRRP